MFGFDTVDSLVADLKSTASKLQVLGAAKLQRAAYLEAKATETRDEATRAARVSSKLFGLIE